MNDKTKDKSKDMCASGGMCEGICRRLYRNMPVRDKKNIPTSEKRLCTGAFLKTTVRRKRKHDDDDPRRQRHEEREPDKYKGLFDY